MRQLLLFGMFLLSIGIGICRGASGEISFFTPDELQAGITGHQLDFDFFLVDVRDDAELQNGIIASRYCRPYHFSWRTDVLRNNYQLFPDTMRILLYCQTGSRAIDAASFLAGKGFRLIGCLTGGIQAYGGDLHDSLECKPWSLLPEPSYFRDTTLAAITKRQPFFIAPHANRTGRVFTLQGRIVRQCIEGENAAAYLLINRDGVIMPMAFPTSRTP